MSGIERTTVSDIMIGKNILGIEKTSLLISSVFLLFAAGCGNGDEASEGKASAGADFKKTRITFFAAASMTETLSAIEKKYERAHPDTDIVFSFDSSGTLKTQITEGAYCDIFMSASPKQMNQLDKDGGGYVRRDTRTDLLENKLVLAAAHGNPKNIGSFEELPAAVRSRSLLLAVGNTDVPAGQYAMKLFDYYGMKPEDLFESGSVTLGSNVKEITSQVREGTADAGIIYATDARAAGLAVVDEADTGIVGRVIYPVAVLKQSVHADAAIRVVEYLKSPEAASVFEEAGFTVIRSAPAGSGDGKKSPADVSVAEPETGDR